MIGDWMAWDDVQHPWRQLGDTLTINNVVDLAPTAARSKRKYSPRDKFLFLSDEVTGTLVEAAHPERPLRQRLDLLLARLDARRVGKECVSTCRFRGSPDH